MIKLRKYALADFNALNSYRLDDAQAQFTADIDYCVNERQDLADDNKTLVVIVSGDEPVGFFVLDVGVEKFTLTDNANAVLVRSLSVNPSYQGKGIGTQAMALVPDFLREHLPNVDEIVLSVNCKNLTAYHIYLKAGYLYTGEKIDGPMGQQRILHMMIEKEHNGATQRLEAIEKLLFQCQKDVKRLKAIRKELQRIAKNQQRLGSYYESDYIHDFDNADSFDRHYQMLDEDSIWNTLREIDDQKVKLLKKLAKYL